MEFQTKRWCVRIDPDGGSGLSLRSVTELGHQPSRSRHFQSCPHHEDNFWTRHEILLLQFPNYIALRVILSVEKNVRTESTDARSFPHSFSLQRDLFVVITVWKVWPTELFRHEWTIPAAKLKFRPINPAVELHSLFLEIGKTALECSQCSACNVEGNNRYEWVHPRNDGGLSRREGKILEDCASAYLHGAYIYVLCRHDVKLRTPKAIRILGMLAATCVFQGPTNTMYTLGTLTNMPTIGYLLKEDK